MIPVTTEEFLGALRDVIPFASADTEDPAYNVIRLDYVDGALYALASNRSQHVRCEINTSGWEIGSDDAPFSVRVPLADMKNAVSVFRLPKKHAFAQVGVSVVNTGLADGLYRVSIHREGMEGSYSTFTMHLPGRGAPMSDTDPAEPDIHGIIEEKTQPASSLTGVAFHPRHLANFGKVRDTYGPVKFEFPGEPWEAVRVHVGDQFHGVIWPVKEAIGNGLQDAQEE